MEGRRNKSGDDQSHAFLDPDGDEDEHASDVEGAEVLMNVWPHQQHGRDDHKGRRGPNPGDEGVLSVVAKVKILSRDTMGAAGVEGGEDFRDHHHQIDEDGDAHDPGESADRTFSDFDLGDSADELEHDDDEGWTGDECGCEEAWGEQGGVPERAATKSAVEEGGHRVNGNGPGDAEEDEGDIPAFVGDFAEEPLVDEVTADVEIEQ